MKNFRRILAGMLILFLAAGFHAPVKAEAGQKKATVMVYLCGSSLESNGLFKVGQGTETISSIVASRFNPDEINVVAVLGGTSAWLSGYDTDKLTILEFGGRRPAIVDSMPLSSMGDASTLTNFLTYCKEKYPADSYDLVMWDHGGGPIYGVCQDMLFEGDTLDMFEFSSALQASPFADKGLDLIAFNACLMGSAETAEFLAPYAKYMVGTEDSMFGLTYDWLAGMENDASVLDTAIRIVDNTFEFNQAVIERQKESQINAVAVIDLSAMDEVNQAMNAFFENVIPDLDEKTFTFMSTQRRDTTAFGFGDSGNVSDFDLVDLQDMVEHFREIDPEGADAVKAAMEKAVVHYRAAVDSCSGLTVYHPYNNKEKLEERISIYNSLDFMENYKVYVQNFAAKLTGIPLASWVDLETGKPGPSKDNRTLFTLALTEDQAQNYGASQLYVLKMNGDDTYSFTFANDGTSLDDGNLTGEFSGTALYAVDAEGNALSQELEYVLGEDGRYLIPAVLVKTDEETGEAAEVKGLITCTLDKETKKLTPGGVQVWEEALGGYTTAYNLTFEDFDAVILTSTSRKETRNENGTLLSFDEWEEAGHEDWEGSIDGSWGFALLNDTIDTTELYATFQVNDSQNYIYSSEPLVVKTPGPDIGEIRTAYDDANLVLINNMNIAPLDGGAAISGSVTNLTDTEALIEVENMTVNGNAVDAAAEVVGSGENWGLLKDEEQLFYVILDDQTLAGIDTITSITFDLTLLDAATEEAIGTVPVEVTLNLAL